MIHKMISCLCFQFTYSYSYSLTQPLRTAVKVGGLVVISLDQQQQICTRYTETCKNAFVQPNPVLEKRTQMSDQTTVPKLMNMISLKKKCYVKWAVQCILHEPQSPSQYSALKCRFLGEDVSRRALQPFIVQCILFIYWISENKKLTLFPVQLVL